MLKRLPYAWRRLVHKLVMPDTSRTIETLQLDLLAYKTTNRLMLKALADIAYHCAQNGEHALQMRAIATNVLYPKKESTHV